MKKLLFLGVTFICLHSYAQEFKDTTFSVKNFTCSCKYNLNDSDDTKIFDRSEKVAHYPGGEKEWNKFVKENIYKGYKGKHMVEVRFQVDKNGNLSGFTLLKAAPNQKYEEVLRLLQSSGKWFPSVQNGYCVKSTVRLEFEL